MQKTKSSAVLTGATTVGVATMTRSKLGLVALATAGAVMLGAPGAFAITMDPLHGQCNGSGGGACIDNGTNTPLGNSTSFSISISPSDQTGDLVLEVLVPNNK